MGQNPVHQPAGPESFLFRSTPALLPDSIRFLRPDAARPSWRLRTKAHLETGLLDPPPGDAPHARRRAFAHAIRLAPGTLFRTVHHCARPTLSPQPLTDPRRLHQQQPAFDPWPAPRPHPAARPHIRNVRSKPSAGAPPRHALASPPALRQGDASPTPPLALPQAPSRAVAASGLPPPRPHFRAPTMAEPKSAAAAALGSARWKHTSGVPMEMSRCLQAALPALVGVGTKVVEPAARTLGRRALPA